MPRQCTASPEAGHISRPPLRQAAALGLAWLAYSLFYVAVLALVIGVPIGLLILLARVLLS
jgi:hypothetical protein